jgi:hypothetical protein
MGDGRALALHGTEVNDRDATRNWAFGGKRQRG